MKKRWIALTLALVLAFTCALPCLAEGEIAEDLTNAGNEVDSEQSNYFLYAVIVVAVAAVVIVGVAMYLKRRRGHK